MTMKNSNVSQPDGEAILIIGRKGMKSYSKNFMMKQLKTINLIASIMCKSKSLFVLGIIAGVVSFISCLMEMEMMQYISGFACLVLFMISDHREKKSYTSK